MSTEQYPQAEEFPSVLKLNIHILGVGHFQGKDEMVTISQHKKALYITPDKYIRPVAGVWVCVNQLESYHMDFTHGLLYMPLKDSASLPIATKLSRMAQPKDLMDSKTKLRGSALRMWLVEDVNLTWIVDALDNIGVPYAPLHVHEDLAKCMFVGIKVPARHREEAVPLDKRFKRSHAPDNPLTKRHADLLHQRMATLYQNGTASDCKLISRDGKEFLSHWTILSAWSPVFANMFATNMTEKASGVCRLENFDGHVVDALLSFLYKGMLPDIDQSVEDVLDIADQYEIPDLRSACEETLAANITSKNAPRYLYVADLRGLGSLKTTAAKFIGEHVSDF